MAKTIWDYLTDAGETMATLGTGAVAPFAGGAYGIYKGVTSPNYGTIQGGREADRAAIEMTNRLTYQPRGEATRGLLGAVGGAVGGAADFLKLPPVLPEAAILGALGLNNNAIMSQTQRGMQAAKPMVGNAMEGYMARTGLAPRIMPEGGLLGDKAFDVSKADASDIFGAGAQKTTYKDPESGGYIQVLTRPDQPASVTNLEVPEAFRKQGVGGKLQAQASKDFPNMQGQVSSKAAAKSAYKLGRRPVGQPSASLDEVLKAIDDNSSVNLVSPARQQEIGGSQGGLLNATPVNNVTDTLIFHGTSPSAAKSIEKAGFDVAQSADGTIWFTTNPAIGEVAATAKGAVVSRNLNESNLKLATWDDIDKYSVNELINMGYDGVKMPSGNETTYQIFNPEKLTKLSGKSAAPQTEALKVAQSNAALPVEQGGLGLPANNTPMDRALAMNFQDAFHETEVAKLEKLSRSNAFKVSNPQGGAGDPLTPMGVFTKPTGKRIGISRQNAEVQMPLMISPSGPTKSFADRPELLAYINQYPEVASAVKAADDLDVQMARHLEDIEDRANDLREKGKDKAADKLLDDNFYDDSPVMKIFEQKYKDLSLEAKTKLTDLFKSQGIGNVNIKKDTADGGLVTESNIVLNPADVRSRFAAFDPFRRKESNILAGALPFGILGADSALSDEQMKGLIGNL